MKNRQTEAKLTTFYNKKTLLHSCCVERFQCACNKITICKEREISEISYFLQLPTESFNQVCLPGKISFEKSTGFPVWYRTKVTNVYIQRSSKDTHQL